MEKQDIKKIQSKKALTAMLIAFGSVTAMCMTLVVHNKQPDQPETAGKQVVAPPPSVAERLVKVAPVQRRSLAHAIEANGIFTASRCLPLIAEAQGTLTEFRLEEGQVVTLGQIVAKIDAATVKPDLSAAEAALKNAVANKERYERLLKAGAISQKQYEEAALGLESAEARLNSARQRMKFTIVRSPISGIAYNVKGEKGSFAIPGMQLGSVADVSTLKMTLTMSPDEIAWMKKDRQVPVWTEIYPGHLFLGTVALISATPDTAKNYQVEIVLSNSKIFPLKAGMTGTAKFDPPDTDTTSKLLVPVQAVLNGPTQPQVFVLNRDSTVLLADIELGAQVGNEWIVLRGLRAEEHVVISGLNALRSRDRVRVVN